MKKRKYIREALNLTQEEMAMLLDISRSQWAHYEIGLKELSNKGLINESRASNFLASLDSNDLKNYPISATLDSEKSKFIANAIKKNELEIMACKRTIERLEKNYTAAIKLFKVTDFFLQSEVDSNMKHREAIKVLNEIAVKTLHQNGPKQLYKLEIRQKVLAEEKLLLSTLLK
jgi:transcriptional regulator with XRE-family HTH domain